MRLKRCRQAVQNLFSRAVDRFYVDIRGLWLRVLGRGLFRFAHAHCRLCLNVDISC